MNIYKFFVSSCRRSQWRHTAPSATKNRLPVSMMTSQSRRRSTHASIAAETGCAPTAHVHVGSSDCHVDISWWSLKVKPWSRGARHRHRRRSVSFIQSRRWWLIAVTVSRLCVRDVSQWVVLTQAPAVTPPPVICLAPHTSVVLVSLKTNW